MQPDQAIGVFDSGVGGLSVLAHIRAQLPHEKLVYVADSAFMPYGCKAEQVIEARCMRIADFFTEQRCKAVVIACNTATAVAVHRLREAFSFPVIGMEPAVKPAVAQSRSGVVGVLVTSGTATSRKFNDLADRFAEQARVIVQPCPGLVEQIESGDLNGKQTAALLEAFVRPLLESGVDTLVLGCTHYPFVLPLIRQMIGPDVTVIDAGDAIALELQRQLQRRHLLAEYRTTSVEFWSSGEGQIVEPLMSDLWNERILLKQLPF